MKYKEALKTMIAGETEATIAYTAFAQKAKESNLPGIALLFKALTKAERIHIKNHSSALKEEFVPSINEEVTIGTTEENLISAIAGEREESKVLYPKLMKGIKDELNSLEGKVANLSLEWAMQAEKEHGKLLKEALKALQKGSDLPYAYFMICKVCGNVIAPEKQTEVCKLCGHDAIFYSRMDV